MQSVHCFFTLHFLLFFIVEGVSLDVFHKLSTNLFHVWYIILLNFLKVLLHNSSMEIVFVIVN